VIHDAPSIVTDPPINVYDERPKINDPPPVVIDGHVTNYDAPVTVSYQVVNAPDATDSIDDHGVVILDFTRRLTRERQ